MAVPRALRWGINLTGGRQPLAPLAGSVVRRQMRGFAKRFIVGRDATGAVPALKALRDRGIGFTLDVLGEASVSEAEAEAYQRTYLDLLDGLAATAAAWPPEPAVDEAVWGPVPRVNLSIKITSLYSQIDPLDFAGSLETVKDRLRPIFRKAMADGAALTLDLEQFRYRDLTYSVFTSLMDEEEFRGYDDAGVVLQAYLRDADRDLDELLAWARDRGRFFSLRLVKGAYWDYETVLAAQEGWPVPVFTHKPDADAMYEKLARVMLEHGDHVRPAFASHNVRSLAAAIEAARDLGLPDGAFEIQMLHGMGDPIKQAVRGMGLRLREYAPVGELLPGMAYLVRRLLENTANDSFLRQTFVEGHEVDELVRPPAPSADFGAAPVRLRRAVPTDPEKPGPFANMPRADFSRRENRASFDEALARVRASLGAHHSLRIGGRDTESARTLTSVNPSAPDEVIGTVAYGGRAEAEAAVAAARAALPAWRDTPAAERAAVLFSAAELMRREAVELAALEMLEAGKPRREADGDVTEAVDFLEYYGREALRLAQPRVMGHVPGEHNVYFYEPRGVALVIAPWNFPLAILTGMTAAALVTGNPVIVKPAGPTPVIAAQLVRILEAAGAPPGTVNYLPSPGGEVGDFLVRHPGVDLIAFTGSMEVGLHIMSQAAQNPARDAVKKVIAEMGGKNAVIVDADADLDLAVSEVVASAFNYAGQKCSAASRVIVLEAAYDDFVRRLIEATRSLRVGPAEDPATRVPPVITAEARDRILGFIETGRREGTLAATVEPPSGGEPGGLLRAAARVHRGAAGRGDRPGGDLRAGGRRAQSRRHGRGAGHRQRRALRPHRRPHQPQSRLHRARAPRVPRGQPVHQPRHHRRPGRAPAVRRLQDERRRLQGRRPGLPAPVHGAARHHREHHAPRLRPAGGSARGPLTRRRVGPRGRCAARLLGDRTVGPRPQEPVGAGTPHEAVLLLHHVPLGRIEVLVGDPARLCAPWRRGSSCGWGTCRPGRDGPRGSCPPCPAPWGSTARCRRTCRRRCTAHRGTRPHPSS